MNEKLITLKEAIPNGILGLGIFNSMLDTPWGDTYSNQDLDLEFFSLYNNKPISPLLENFYVEGGISELNLNRISTLILNKFRPQWEHKYKLLTIEYDPTKNYEMVETGTNQNTGRDTVTLSDTTNGSNNNEIVNNETRTESENAQSNNSITTTESQSNTGTDTLVIQDNSKRYITFENQNDVYGFNSVNKVPNDTRNSNSTDTFTDARTDTRTLNLSNSVNGTGENDVNFESGKEIEINSTHTETGSFSNTHSGNNIRNMENSGEHSTTVKGISSFYSTQKLIQSEIDLWRWNFLDDVFKDVASVLTLSIYRIEI